MSEDFSNSPDPDEEGGAGLPAQLRDPMGVLRRQSKWILATFILLAIGAGVATVLFPLKYEARATIMLSAKSIPDEFVPTTIIANILEQFEAIKGEVFSRAGLTKIISSTGLYSSDRDSVPMQTLAQRLAGELKVASITPRVTRELPTALTFEVTLSGPDPELLANVVNFAIAELTNANVEFRSRQARVTTKFMQQEFDRADEALREHQRKLAQFRSLNRGSLPEEQQATLANLERFEEQRRSAILRISDLRAQLERLERGSGGASPGSEDESVDSLRERLRKARAIYTDDHPTVRSIERQLSALEESERTNPKIAADRNLGVRSELDGAIQLEQRRLEQIDLAARDFEKNLELGPSISEEYSALVREEQILQENYVEYLRKLKDAELALSLERSQQGAQLITLDSAIPPTSPVIPRWAIAGVGLLVSIGVAFVVGVARELIFPVVIDEAHLESVFSAPCIGSISEIA